MTARRAPPSHHDTGTHQSISTLAHRSAVAPAPHRGYLVPLGEWSGRARLAAHFGDDQVFMDVDTIQDGQRRLKDPDDLVHVAIAAALERDVRVIPILVAGAVMARRQDLPEGLERLARRNALSVRHVSSRSDADRLLAAIELILRSPAAAGPVAPSPARVVSEAVEATEVAAAPSVVQVLRHDKIVNRVAFSPDGRLLATASHDDSARVWALIR